MNWTSGQAAVKAWTGWPLVPEDQNHTDCKPKWRPSAWWLTCDRCLDPSPPPPPRLMASFPFLNSRFWNANRHGKLSRPWTRAKDFTWRHVTFFLDREVRMCLRPVCLLPTYSPTPSGQMTGLIVSCAWHQIAYESCVLNEVNSDWKGKGMLKWWLNDSLAWWWEQCQGNNESIMFTPQHANPNILENFSLGLKKHLKMALFMPRSHTSGEKKPKEQSRMSKKCWSKPKVNLP